MTSFPPRSLNIGQSYVFRHRVGFIRNGIKHLVTPWRNNLILDSGLNKVASQLLCDCFKNVIFSAQVSPTPVSRPSGSITFTQAGTTITASGNYFVSTDTGRLFKWGTGTTGAEVYLTYISATQATASIAATVSTPDIATVWYVNDTALNSVLQTSGSYDTSPGACGTTASGNVLTHQRTYTGTALASPATFTEIGFTDSGTTNIFDRDLISPNVSLLAGDIPLAVAQLIVTYSPDTLTAIPNRATGFNSAGNIILNGLGMGNSSGVSQVNSTGGTIAGSTFLEPNITSGGTSVYATTNFTVPAFSNGVGSSIGATSFMSDSVASYSAGTFRRDSTHSLGIAAGNGTIYGFSIGRPPTTGLVLKLTTPFTKTSAQTFSITFRRSWQRIITN